ncbi:MHYT domain-containing protein [Actinoplanes sp. NBRC 101535]|uniref:MHYT domain-containing protein n=1 Tax=Actinoplanes sp. NBRC 101535 TaxID=3032196 RepID=UPI0024A21F2D|nr:MHYT domain-containing protein [Actinoplanes sp. NBRC 101535]GLY01322.1 hypothetical protein Acsp01_17010 [Actinoplanes sp. NBRC 101535]
MAEIHHFDHGWITPAVSYLLSVLGSLLGLTAAVRLRGSTRSGERIWWLILATVAIGATGIWSMHFVAMTGFKVDGTPIRYDVGLTVASAVIAFVAVGAGLAIALLGTAAQQVRILAGGLLAGLGVAAMHYTGMAAMRLHGEIHYAGGEVVLSIAIAVVAATVALWLALVVHRPLAIAGSALLMGVAVNGMHFTGMLAMSVTRDTGFGSVSGANATTMLIPIGAAVLFAVIGMGYSLMAAPNEDDRAAAEYLASRLEAREQAPATGVQPGQLWGQRPPSQPADPGPRRSALGNGDWTYRDRGPQ